MIEAFKFGILQGGRQWRVAAIIYFFQLCLAVTIGLQVMEVFQSSIGNSLEFNKLLQHYDHTVISDFLKIHGASITPLIGQLRWLLLIYLLFAVFIDAGLLACASQPETANVQTFWQGGASYFFPFLKIALVFLGLVLLWTAVIWIPVGIYLEPALENLPNEKYVVWGVLTILLIYVLGLCGLFLWSVSSRLWKLRTGATIFASLRHGGRQYWKNKGRSWGLLGLFFCLQVGLVALYWLLDAFIGMTSPVLIVLMFVVQQGFSFLRVVIRQMCYMGLGRILNRTS
jgi:hypothetical protein